MQNLVNHLLSLEPCVNNNLIKKAVEFAIQCHINQFRLSGAPFIHHPLSVAIHVAKYTKCTSTIIAALLHDIIEDTDTTYSNILEIFGTEVNQIVEGLTRCGKYKALTIKSVINQIFYDMPDEFVKKLFKEIFELDNNCVLQPSQAYIKLDKCISGYNHICQNNHSRCNIFSVTHIVKEILHMVDSVQKFLPKQNQMSVSDSLQLSFHAYTEDIIKKICLIKICDRIDNLKTLYVFDKIKQQRIKQNTLEDILPLTIYLNIFELFNRLIQATNKILYKTVENPFTNYYKLPNLDSSSL